MQVEIEYKCRKCGSIYSGLGLGSGDNLHFAERMITEMLDAVRGKTTPNGITETIVHACDLKAQSWGVADLIGCRVVG